MTPKERSQVIELKKKAKEEGKSSKGTGKRKASATGSSERDDAQSEGEEETDDAEPLSQSATSLAGKRTRKRKLRSQQQLELSQFGLRRGMLWPLNPIGESCIQHKRISQMGTAVESNVTHMLTLVWRA